MVLLADRQTRIFEGLRVAVQGVEKRICFLDPADRKLIEVTLHGKLSRREVGLLVGMTAGAVTRRVQQILKRLDLPIVRRLVDDGQLLPEGYREVALAYFLRRTSIREVARASGRSEYDVRRILTYVRGWHGPSRRTRR